MISLMGESFTSAIKESGYFNIIPYDGWNVYNILATCSEMPFKIIYMSYGVPDVQRIFDCAISLTNKFMIVKDVDITKESIFANVKTKDFLKSLTYSWLCLSVEALEDFGISRKKTKMSLRCSLPGAADIMLERGYRRIHRDGDKKLEQSEIFGESRDSSKYIGLKDLI